MTSRQKMILVLLLGAQFMLAIDFSILNVALPSIGRGVGISLGHLQWIATAFSLPTAGLTLMGGRVGDFLGRRRVFMSGLVLLLVGSIVGGLATQSGVLLTARALQGVAAAVTIPTGLSLLISSFEDGPARQKALGLNGSLLAAGFTTGAVVGGLLTGFASWRWAFLVNVPVAAVLLAATPALIPSESGVRSTRMDVPGGFTITAGLLALVYGVVTGGNQGWGRPEVWPCIAVGAVFLGAFWAVEKRSSSPLVSLDLLHRPAVKWGNVGGFTVFAMETAVVFLMTLYLQKVLGFSPLVTGLLFGVPGAAAFISGLVAPRTIARLGPKRVLVGGLALQGASNVLLLIVGRSQGWVAAVLVICAFGFFVHAHGLVGFLVTSTSDVRSSEQGLATAVTTMTQQVSIALGIPLIATIATASAGGSSAGRLLHGIRIGLGADALLTLVVATAIGVAFAKQSRRVRSPQSRSGTPPHREPVSS